MDFSNYLIDSATTSTSWWRYEFPNGHSASVIPEFHSTAPFRFEVMSTDPDDRGRGGVVGDLGTGAVEAKLAKLAGLPQNEETA